MIRLAAIFLLVAGVVGAANVRLYLTDGGYHVVREYEVQTDRVRFYSVERSQWEEMPRELIDLERTEREIEEHQAAERQEAEFWNKEDAAERERQQEIARVPMDPGVYFVDGDKMLGIPRAELDLQTNKKKSILSKISPIPIIPGEKKVLIRGPHAEVVLRAATPEFYLRLFHEERFAIIRLTPKNDDRHVETWQIAPVTNEVFEEHEGIEVLRRQVDRGLYKVWPKAPLEPGEYAVIEFSPGEANVQAWDFGYWPSGSPPKP